MFRPIAVTALLALLALPTSARAAAPSASVDLEQYRKTIALHATVRGVDGFFVLDTGSGLTLLSPEFARRVGCQPAGHVVGFTMMGTRIDSGKCDDVPVTVGGRVFTAPVAGVFDVMTLFPAGAVPIDGLIGLNAFERKVITIDFPRKRLFIESPGSLRDRIRRGIELPTRLARELQGRSLTVNVGVPVSGGRVWFELDSGNGGTLLVDRASAPLFGLDPASKQPQEGTVHLAKGLDASGAWSVHDMILEGNLGMPFLQKQVVTFDLDKGRVWIERPRESR